MTMNATYNPKIFDVEDLEAAQDIILTPEVGLTTADRWEAETPYLLSLMKDFNLNKDSLVVDYGCGIGRLSKEIIAQNDCHVVGVDISMNMRSLSHIYVNSDKFAPISKDFLPLLQDSVDAVLAVWVLQHTFNLDEEISNIKKILKPGGKLFVVNEKLRCIPTDKGWMNDGKDIFISLQSNFKTEVIDNLDASVVSDQVSRRTFYGMFTKVEQ